MLEVRIRSAATWLLAAAAVVGGSACTPKGLNNAKIQGDAPQEPSWFTPPPVVLPKAAVESVGNPGAPARPSGGATPTIAPNLPSFPGAQGFGAKATGGRGGKVVRVTTLAPLGAGSLQAALDLPGPRIIVFAVSGAIRGDVVIKNGDVTIAGQTAPGAGITIEGRLRMDPARRVRNIVMRHLRVRPRYDGSPGDQFDALSLPKADTVMIDHCSFAWGVDDTVDLYGATEVTVQWSTIEESATVGHPKANHNYGLTAGKEARKITLHHDLLAHHMNRAPAIANGPAEMKNVVVYNVRHGFVHHDPAAGAFSIVGNSFIQGPNDAIHPFYFRSDSPAPGPGLAYFLKDNHVDDPGRFVGLVQDPWSERTHPSFGAGKLESVAPPEVVLAAQEPSFASIPGYVPVKVEDPLAAKEAVLAQAGAFPRDVVTKRVVADVRARTGAWGARPAPNLMEGLTTGLPLPDSDGDGMDDAWESSKSLDPKSAKDVHNPLEGGYPAIEAYLQHLSDRAVAAGR